MRPNPDSYRGDDPDYLRELIARAGISHREAARICSEKPGDFRRYLNGARKAPYLVQFALEQLAADGDRANLAGVVDGSSTISARLDTHPDCQLVEFARVVLRSMESTEEWSADMIDDFQTAADSLGLCGVDVHGMFRIRPVPALEPLQLEPAERQRLCQVCEDSACEHPGQRR